MEDATTAFSNVAVLKSSVNPIVKYLFIKISMKSWIRYAEMVLEKQRECARDGLTYRSDPTEASGSEGASSGETESEEESSFESSEDSEQDSSYYNQDSQGRTQWVLETGNQSHK